MTIDAYRNNFSQRLSDLYIPEEAGNLCVLTLEYVLNMNRVEVSLSRKQELSPSQLSHLEEVLWELEKGKPIQYIIGKTEFYGLELQVNPSTLIPRPETEELVEWIILNVEENNNPTLRRLKADDKHKRAQPENVRILDIGTGSGCIAIALAKNLRASKVEGVDISQNALATAYQNAKANQVEIDFYNQNILETEILDESYDIVVSNPPYVREQEKQMMRENVLSNEPASALFVSDKDPLIFYQKIGELAHKSLRGKGMLFFEINEYLGKETVDLIKDIGYTDVVLKKDMFGKDRMIRAMR